MSITGGWGQFRYQVTSGVTSEDLVIYWELKSQQILSGHERISNTADETRLLSASHLEFLPFSVLDTPAPSRAPTHLVVVADTAGFTGLGHHTGPPPMPK